MSYSVVFLGPSLDRSDASGILDAVYLPPVTRGDIDRVLSNGIPDAIGIVDGQFFQSFSVSPKEVLRALDAGCRVFGAASMGALRAVELAPFGMVGVGDIFGLYANGVIDADDEVAMVYDSETLRPLSVPLVNMRIALGHAVEHGVVPADYADRFLASARRLYYPERTYQRVFHALDDCGHDNDKFADHLAREASDAKRNDAISMLRAMRDALGSER